MPCGVYTRISPNSSKNNFQKTIYAKATTYRAHWQTISRKYHVSPACMYSSGVPPCLLVRTKQLATNKMAQGGDRTPKRPVGAGRKIPKKQKIQDGKAQWKDNKKYDATLKSVKQNIVQAHDRINLGMLMHANGTITGKVLSSLGNPKHCLWQVFILGSLWWQGICIVSWWYQDSTGITSKGYSNGSIKEDNGQGWKILNVGR